MSLNTRETPYYELSPFDETFMKQQLLQFHLGFFWVQWDLSAISQEMPKLQLFSAKELRVGKSNGTVVPPHPTSCLPSPSLSRNTPAAQKHWGPNSKSLIHCYSWTVLKCSSYVVLPGGICLERSAADELSHLPVFWLRGAGTLQLPREPRQGCTVWGWEKSQGFGKGVSISFLDPDNKRKNHKKTGQMAALVKAEDMGDRDKHEGLHGRSWGCGDLWVQLRVSAEPWEWQWG